MNHQFWNKAAIYGILLALITILFSVLQTVLPSDSKILGFSLWAIKLAGTVGLLFYVMKDFGKEQDTYLYANAFKFGLAVSFCSSIIAAAYYYLHVMFLFPESSSQMANAMLMGLEQAGVTEADFNIDKLIDRLPVILTLSQFVYFNILGLLWSSLLANGAKHPTDKTPFN